MTYLTTRNLELLGENEYLYVNRNIFNAQIAKYEIHSENEEEKEALKILLRLWQEIYEIESETNRIIPLIKMKSKDMKICFSNFRKLPKGSFYPDYD